MHKMRVLTLTLSAAIVGMMLLSPPALAGPHDAGYYVCNADDTAQTKYYRYVKKRSDAQEKSFKQAVLAAAGAGCRSVSYPKKEPTTGNEI